MFGCIAGLLCPQDQYYVTDAIVPIACGMTGAFLIVAFGYVFGKHLRNRKRNVATVSVTYVVQKSLVIE